LARAASGGQLSVFRVKHHVGHAPALRDAKQIDVVKRWLLA